MKGDQKFLAPDYALFFVEISGQAKQRRIAPAQTGPQRCAPRLTLDMLDP